MPADSLKARAYLPAALALFAVSGFAGLIYESIWSHYLKLLLGHAAYAQTLVLAIFMGGMAAGAWLASRLSPRWRDLLLAYALAEALVGLASFAFHGVFTASSALVFEHMAPALGAPLAAHAAKWALASALILPQSVLLGMTFPFMTGGVLRARPARPGYTVAILYFANSLGAACGVLASGFYFIGAAGLPGTLIAAGSLNLAVALGAIVLRKLSPAPSALVPPPAAATRAAASRLLLAVSALTGFSSFLYEIGWIRMLAMVLGASTHAFELMLSAFILGLACGGWWVRRRIEAAGDLVRTLAWVQLAMGAAALATLPLYGATFRAMQLAMTALAPTDGGYLAFNLVSHGIALAVMFPATFCAGMTLPLITAALLRAGAGERAIGRVYAANTLGAIAGVAVAVHVALPLAGLKGLLVAGAAIDLALGVLLLRGGAPRPLAAAAALAAGALGLAALGPPLDVERMASGVFRTGALPAAGARSVELHIDGKTATVSVLGDGRSRALLTNGKSDGALRIDGGPPRDDEVMMALFGALPQFLAPQARHAANIGFGTGVTSHVLLASATLERLDTVEIEPAIVRAAAGFRPRNARAFDDPRSRVHYEDAKTFFSASGERYDVILSEPSNPWVSGVASLFTAEFYRDIRRRLQPGGLFLQWVHVYEMSPELLASIMAALGQSFASFELWMPNHGDLIVVASAQGAVPRPDPGAFGNAALRAELERFHIRNLDDLLLHRVGGTPALAPFFRQFGAPPNSDFFPLLDLGAPRARFLRRDVEDLVQLGEAVVPVLELFEPAARPDPRRLSPGERPWLRRALQARQALAVAGYLRGEASVPEGLPADLAGELALLRTALRDCRPLPAAATARALDQAAGLINPHLPRAEREALWRSLGRAPCAARLPPEVRGALRLHSALAGGNARAMAQAGGDLLQAGGGGEGEGAIIALAAHMAGLALAGERQAALQAFATHRDLVAQAPAAWQPAFRLLLGQAGLR